MRGKIDCFLACDDKKVLDTTIEWLENSRTAHHIHLIDKEIRSSETIREIASKTDADYALLLTKATPLTIGMSALERMLRVAADADAAMLYSDHYSMENGEMKQHPAIDYQKGSIRDDFDFGSLLLRPRRGLPSVFHLRGRAQDTARG